jgi:hypothetical protein
MKDTVIYYPSEEVSNINNYFPNEFKKVDSIRIEESDHWLLGDQTTYWLESGESWTNPPDYTGLAAILGILFAWILIFFVIYKFFRILWKIKKNTDKIREHLESQND